MNSSWTMGLPMMGSLNEPSASMKFMDFPLSDKGGVSENDGTRMGKEMVHSFKVAGGVVEL